MKVYVVIIRSSEDYHGSSDEIHNIYESEDDARAVVEKFNEDGPHGFSITSYEYFYETFEIIPKK